MLFSRCSQSQKMLKKFFKTDILAPIIVGILALVLWDMFVRITHLPPYILPGPLLVFKTLITDWNELFPSLLITLQITKPFGHLTGNRE